jgi:hypothetical protein
LVVALVILLSNCILACSKEGNKPSSTPSMPEYAHYVNWQFLFSVDYPKDWLLEEVNPNGVEIGIGIKPKDSKYNQIQITVYNAPPLMRGFEDSFVADSQRTSLQQFFEQLGASNLNILVNKRASGMWDWEVSFTVTYEDTPLQGGVFTKEKYINDEECTVYSLFYMHTTDFPEVLEVVNSFAVID